MSNLIAFGNIFQYIRRQMKHTVLQPNIHYLRFETQYEVCSTLLRLQEFYESPFPEIRGKYFGLEKYMDRYAKEYGNFTYTKDWNGFNIPGHVVSQFFEVFKPGLGVKESNLYEELEPVIESGKKFYVIAVWRDDDFNHELAHAFYYLDENYKKDMDSIISSSDCKKLEEVLKKEGYTEEVFKDELQAYLATSTKSYLKKFFKIDLEDIKDIRKNCELRFKHQLKENSIK